MAHSFALTCCSTADLTAEHFRSRDISYICFHYYLNGVPYDDDLGQSMPFDRFYAEMAAGAMTRTSQVNTDEFEAFFEGFLSKGLDVLHVCLSSGISGVINSATAAQMHLSEKYPDRKILILDSLGASSGYGLLMDRLADLRDDGMDIDQVYAWGMENRLHLHHWFFSTDLTYYVRGGRISRAMGWFGTVLRICPLLNMDNLGRLIPRRKVRTKPRVIQEIARTMFEHAQGGTAYSGRCYISHADCLQDALAVREQVEERIPALRGKVQIFDIGTTIGAHTGPGTVALFFLGDERKD